MAEKTLALPAEYQAGMDEADYQRLLALQIAKTNMPVPQGQMVSGHYIKPSNLQYLSNTIGNVQASSAAARAQAIRQQVMQKFLQDQQREKEAVVQMTGPQEQQLAGPPAQGETMGTEMIPPNLLKAQRRAESSQYPEVQDLAKALQERNKNLFDETAKHSGAASVRTAAMAGGDVSKMEPTTWSPLRIEDTPGGKFAVSQSTQGGQQVHGFPTAPEPKGIAWGRDEISAELKRLRDAKIGFGDINQLQSSLKEAYQLVKAEKINTGAMASEVTALQSMSKLLGIEPPTAVPVTQYVRSVLVPQLSKTLQAIRQSGSQSNAELKVAMDRALDIDRDPRALEQMLIHAMRASVFAIQEHNKQVGQVESLASKAQVDPEFAAIQRIPFKMEGFSEEEAQTLFPEAFGKPYKPAGTLTKKKEPPKVLPPRPFTPPPQQ